jgi:hypothetical protein
MATNKNHFTRCIWVSYSSEDHPFVNELTEHFDQDAQSRLRLMTYMRDESVPLYEDKDNGLISSRTKLFLKPGESIQDLVEVIASNLRRMLVISPSYLQSEHCIWELASCFSLNLKVPLCVLRGIESFDEIFRPRQYSFMDENEYTLGEALTHIYRKRVVEEMHSDFHLPDGEDLTRYFTEKIRLLNGKNYLAESNSTKIQVVGFIKEYIDLFSTTEIVDNFESFFENIYNRWSKQKYTKKCLEIPLEQNESSEPFKLSHLKELNEDQIKHIVDQLIFNLNGLVEPDLTNAKNEITEFCQLMALHMIDQEWAAEMSMSSLSGIRLRLSVSEDDDKSRQLFDCQLAASVIQQVPVKINPSFNDVAPEVEGLLTLKPLKGNPEQRKIMKESEQERLLLQLIGLVMGCNHNAAITLKASKGWEKRVRARIYSRCTDKETKALNIARLYIDHQKFQEDLDSRWDKLADDLVSLLNKGTDDNRRVRIGTLIVSSRDDGSLIEFVDDHDLLFDHIDFLMERCNA